MRTRLITALLCLLLPACASAPTTHRLESVAPADAGFSEQGLAELADYLEESGSSGMLILRDGRVVFDWGETDRRHVIHSIRKSLLSGLIGIEVARGTIDTTATLAELEIDDIHGLTDAERRARVADLLRSRSGVYHPAAAVSEAMLVGMPERGGHEPGEAFYYNNWDFNVLGAVYERATGRSVFAGFRDDIARPLGMLHYTRTFTRIDGNDPEARIPDTDGVYQYERDKSMYPAYHFRMSAHDLALYGELWRRRGRWNGRQVIPESWIDAATTAYSVTSEQAGIGYGMLWYVLMPNEERTTTSFYHTGAGVHMLGVYPGLRLVFVHRVDTEHGTAFTPDRLYGVIGRVFSSVAPGQ